MFKKTGFLNDFYLFWIFNNIDLKIYHIIYIYKYVGDRYQTDYAKRYEINS